MIVDGGNTFFLESMWNSKGISGWRCVSRISQMAYSFDLIATKGM